MVTLNGRAVLYVEAGGKGLLPLIEPDEPWLREALDALASFVRKGNLKGHIQRLAIERFDGEPLVGSRFEPLLEAAGFRPGPRRMTLSA